MLYVAGIDNKENLFENETTCGCSVLKKQSKETPEEVHGKQMNDGAYI